MRSRSLRAKSVARHRRGRRVRFVGSSNTGTLRRTSSSSTSRHLPRSGPPRSPRRQTHPRRLCLPREQRHAEALRYRLHEPALPDRRDRHDGGHELHPDDTRGWRRSGAAWSRLQPERQHALGVRRRQPGRIPAHRRDEDHHARKHVHDVDAVSELLPGHQQHRLGHGQRPVRGRQRIPGRDSTSSRRPARSTRPTTSRAASPPSRLEPPARC